jgi:hypothetical protein
VWFTWYSSHATDMVTPSSIWRTVRVYIPRVASRMIKWPQSEAVTCPPSSVNVKNACMLQWLLSLLFQENFTTTMVHFISPADKYVLKINCDHFIIIFPLFTFLLWERKKKCELFQERCLRKLSCCGMWPRAVW